MTQTGNIKDALCVPIERTGNDSNVSQEKKSWFQSAINAVVNTFLGFVKFTGEVVNTGTQNISDYVSGVYQTQTETLNTLSDVSSKTLNVALNGALALSSKTVDIALSGVEYIADNMGFASNDADKATESATPSIAVAHTGDTKEKLDDSTRFMRVTLALLNDYIKEEDGKKSLNLMGKIASLTYRNVLVAQCPTDPDFDRNTEVKNIAKLLKEKTLGIITENDVEECLKNSVFKKFVLESLLLISPHVINGGLEGSLKGSGLSFITPWITKLANWIFTPENILEDHKKNNREGLKEADFIQNFLNEMPQRILNAVETLTSTFFSLPTSTNLDASTATEEETSQFDPQPFFLAYMNECIKAEKGKKSLKELTGTIARKAIEYTIDKLSSDVEFETARDDFCQWIENSMGGIIKTDEIKAWLDDEDFKKCFLNAVLANIPGVVKGSLEGYFENHFKGVFWSPIRRAITKVSNYIFRLKNKKEPENIIANCRKNLTEIEVIKNFSETLPKRIPEVVRNQAESFVKNNYNLGAKVRQLLEFENMIL